MAETSLKDGGTWKEVEWGERGREIRPLRAVCYCKPAVVHTHRVLLCGSRSTQQISFTTGLIKDAHLNDKSKVISDFNTFLLSLVNVDFLKSSQIFLSESQRHAGTQSGSRKLWNVDTCMNASLNLFRRGAVSILQSHTGAVAGFNWVRSCKR